MLIRAMQGESKVCRSVGLSVCVCVRESRSFVSVCVYAMEIAAVRCAQLSEKCAAFHLL